MTKIEHITRIRVRYADTDKMGYLYNGNYFSYFEVGRTELMRQYGMVYKTLEDEGYILPLIDSYAKYLLPAYYDDLLDVKAELNYSGGALIKFEYSIYRENQLITTGFTSHIFVTSQGRKPVKPPRLFLDIISSNSKIINKD